MYLTRDEYIALTGDDISELDIIKYNQLFKSAVHPNNYMIDDFYESHGSYPLEIKLAIITMAQYYSDNPQLLTGLIPSSSTVGSTSVSYGESTIKRLTSSSLPQSVRAILLPTNILKPNFNKCIKLIGTPYVAPLTTSPTTLSAPPVVDESGSHGTLHSVETLLQTMPSIDFTFSQERRILDGIVDTGEKSYELVDIIPGWYRSNTSGDDYSNVIIIPNRGYVPKLGDRVSYKLSNRIEYGVINGCDEHLDYNGKVHHYFIYV